MSDDVLKLIPQDRLFVPDRDRHAEALQMLEALFPDGEQCEVKTFDAPEFIDCGQNFEAVICSACGGRLELDPFTEGDPGTAWWYAVQDQAVNEPLVDVQTTMPCCGERVAFADLDFDWPAGFARFELVIWNPNVADNLDDASLANFERVLGCNLRQVRARY